MSKEKIIRGIAAARGIAHGRAFIYETKNLQVFQTPILSVYLKDEIQRFERAVDQTARELSEIKSRINQEIGEDFGQFLDAQILMLRDREIIDSVKKRIAEEKKNAEWIYRQVLESYAQRLGESKDQYFKERVADIWDVGNRVLRNLLGLTHASVLDVPAGSILVAHDISPSEATLINPKSVLGIAVEIGGRTSHTAITARALEIPAVLGVEGLISKVGAEDELLIDGDRGIVIVKPTASRIQQYETTRRKDQEKVRALSPTSELKPETRDGRHVDISANIEFYAEANQAKKYGANGIGLFRTEFLFLTRRGNPTEEEQYRVYHALARTMKPNPVIIRTYDLGGDKIFAGYHEPNPFLGWRAIRVCLEDVEFFKIQLRAILRASVNRNVRIMFPMVATYEEIKRIRLIYQDVRQELIAKKIDFDDNLPIGIMVETPSAALLSSSFAPEVDFFSIGSNDLTQYTLAVDRGNERVSKLFDHFHPGVLRLIREVITAGHEHHIWVGLCGELASDPLAIPLLVGLGIDELSMTPSSIPLAKLTLRSISHATCVTIAQEALDFRTATEVKRYLRRAIRKNFPGIDSVIH